MIWDCFLYNGEKDLLKLRCEEFKLMEPLKAFMPYKHVVIESKFTFTGIEKKLTMTMGDIERYGIQWFPYNEKPTSDPWENEKRTRNYIAEALATLNPHPDDIVIISDVDEIPKTYAIQHYRTAFGLTALQMDVYHFYLNTIESVQTWRQARIMPYSHLRDRSPEEVRRSGFNVALVNAGYHFTYMGGIDRVMAKFKSFAHQEEEIQRMADRDELEHKIATCTSLWGDKVMKTVPITELPYYLQSHPEEFRHMLYV